MTSCVSAPASLRWPKDSAKMRMYSTSHSPRRSGWKPLLHMPQPAKCTMKAGLSTHGLSMSNHLRAVLVRPCGDLAVP